LDLPVFLTGFMGVGKSKIGLVLARRMGRLFFDTDQMVELRAGKAISAIFADEGEESFRRLEHECVLETCARSDVVVALGGGAITRTNNIEAVRGSGLLVCLEADIDTIFARVDRRDDRPLLLGLGPEEKRAKIVTMLRERAPFYDQAHFKLRTSETQSPENTVRDLIELLEHWHAQN
jgi:shikimate kinase